MNKKGFYKFNAGVKNSSGIKQLCNNDNNMYLPSPSAIGQDVVQWFEFSFPSPRMVTLPRLKKNQYAPQFIRR